MSQQRAWIYPKFITLPKNKHSANRTQPQNKIKVKNQKQMIKHQKNHKQRNKKYNLIWMYLMNLTWERKWKKTQA